MTPLTQEWVDKAEGDYVTAGREFRARKNPNYDATCTHAQQCAEKYLKSRLQDANVVFPFTHDIGVLLQLLAPLEPGWLLNRTAWETLSIYAVSYRYPGSSASRDDARDALKICTEIRAAVRLSLGLP